MKKPIKIVLLIAGLLILIEGIVFFFLIENSKQLPEIELTLIDGKKLGTDELTGKVTVINFWATTCSPCRKEIPELVSLHEEYSSKAVQLIGVSMAYDSPDQVIAFKQHYKIPYTLALDIDSAVEKAFEVQAIPVTLLISPAGQIEYRHIGVINVDDMRERIAAMLPDERK